MLERWAETVSNASRALRAKTGPTAPYRYTLVVTYGSVDDPSAWERIAPRCACGCGRKLRGQVQSFDGRHYLGSHAVIVSNDREVDRQDAVENFEHELRAEQSE